MCNVQGRRSHGLPGVAAAEQLWLTIRSPVAESNALVGFQLLQEYEAVHMKETAAWKELPGGGAALRLTIRSPDTELDIVC